MSVFDLFRFHPSQRRKRIGGKRLICRVLVLVALSVLVACGAPEATSVVEAPTATPVPPTATAIPPTSTPSPEPPTPTPVPPTVTSTPEPPTATPSPEPPTVTPTPEPPTPTPGPLGWTQKADLPKARLAPAAAVVDGKIYVIGGLGAPRRVDVYDPGTDTWTQKADAVQPVFLAGAGVVDGKIYVIGGSRFWADSGLARVLSYDPEADLWQEEADMPTARTELNASALDGKIYAMGGQIWENASGTGEVLSIVEEYDPATDSWAQRASLPSRRTLPSAVAVDGKIYALGGMKNAIGGAGASVYVYDPAADTWTRATGMPANRVSSASAVIEGLIYVFGGADDYDEPAESNVWVYDPAVDTWTEKPDMPFERWYMTAGAVDGKIYLIGGTKTEWPHIPYISEVWEYDPDPNAGNTSSGTPTKTPQPTRTPRPTNTPVPTARPLAEGECIAWYEAPSFNEQEVCVEGGVGIVDAVGSGRKSVWIVLDPSQAQARTWHIIFFGWAWLDELGELADTNLNEYFIGNCVRISGPIERFEGKYRIKIKSPDQLEMIDCGECNVPDACVFTD